MRLGKGGRALTFPRAGARGWLWVLASSCLGNANQEQGRLHHCLPGTWPRGVSGHVAPGWRWELRLPSAVVSGVMNESHRGWGPQLAVGSDSCGACSFFKTFAPKCPASRAAAGGTLCCGARGNLSLLWASHWKGQKNPPKTNTFVYSCVQFSLHRAPSAGCCVLPGFGSSQRSCAKGCACSCLSAVTRACLGMGAGSEPPKFPVETRSGRWWLLGKEATRIAVRAAWDVSRGDVNV